MTIKTILATGLLLVSIVGPAAGQAPARLSMRATVDSALRRHPALALAGANLERAKSGVREARAARLPGLNVDGNATRFEEPMIVAPIHEFSLDNPVLFDRTLMQGSISLNYTVFDAARGPRVDRARTLAAAATTSQSAARMQVIADAVRAFLRLRVARETHDAHVQRTFALVLDAERIGQLVTEGRSARVTLLRAQVAVSSSRAELTRARNELSDACHDVARLAGLTAIQVCAATLPPDTAQTSGTPDPVYLSAHARNGSAELQQLAQRVRAAEQSVEEAAALRRPKVMAGGRFIEYAAIDVAPQGEWQAGIQFSYPILTGGSRQAAMDRARAEVNAARAELHLAEWRVDEAVQRAWSAHEEARERAKAFADAVVQAEEVARIDQLAFQAGSGLQTDYHTTQADLLRARAGLTEARAQAILALVEIARLSGQLSEDWIAANVESQP